MNAMWVWKIPEGRLYFLNGAAITRVSQGYSGHPEFKNDPAAVHLKSQGPIPPGVYVIGEPRDTHGGHFLPLQPMSVNVMYGRADFGMHGDRIDEPGTASDGCIILPLIIRQKIAASPDKVLLVIA